jgi:hypothetical protein
MKTTHLLLNLTSDADRETTLVLDWQKSLDGTESTSNMQIIDAWAKAIEDRVDAIEQEIEEAANILDNLLDKDDE